MSDPVETIEEAEAGGAVKESGNVIVQRNSELFSSRRMCQSLFTRKRLDPAEWEISGNDKGWFIRKKGSDAKPKVDVEEVWWVKFNAKSATDQQTDVHLSVNGDMLVIQRGTEIPLLNRFLVCADHTTYPQYSIKPGEPRKTIGMMQIFPYQKIRRGTYEEYMEFRSAGTKKTRESLDVKE